MKVLLNCVSVKRKAGGAFQVALNFIYHTLNRKDIDWYYLVSQDLDDVISVNFKRNLDGGYFVVANQPDFLHSYYSVKKTIKITENFLKPDLVYSLAAPSYFRFQSKEVMRFTNPWVTHPNHYVMRTLGFGDRVYNTLYCWNARRLMRRCEYFITQTDTAKLGITKITGVSDSHVKVISNVLPDFYSNNLFERKKSDGSIINIACVSVPHPNKNIEIIPRVINILKSEFGITNIKFNITFPTEHPGFKNFERLLEKYSVGNQVVNWNYCSQSQLIELYSNCDFFFLPTLLETFSASLLEAMYFNLPIVATDFDFNSDITKDSALYFKPMDPYSAAEKIALLIDNQDLVKELKRKMSLTLMQYSNYRKHFDDTVDFFYYCHSN